MEDDERNLINLKEIFNSTNKFKFLKVIINLILEYQKYLSNFKCHST